MDADALAGAVIDGHEDADLALPGGHGGGHVGPPHLVGPLGDDGPVVGLGAVGMADPLRGLEAVLPHQPPDPLLGGPDALVAEPGPDLAVALAVERRLGQDAADVADQFLVRAGAERPTLLGFGPLLDGDGLLMALEVDRRAGQVPEAADAGQAVRPPGGGGGGLPYVLPPPRDERAVGPAALEQQLVVHGQLADLGPQPGDLVVPVVGRPALQRGLAAGQEVVPPAGEGGGGDAELTGEEFQVLAAEEPEDGRGLALGGEAATLAGVRGVGHGCGLLGLDADDVPTGCPTEPRSGGPIASRIVYSQS